MFPTDNELKQMQQMDIKDADFSELVDISKIEIDMKKSVKQRVQTYVAVVKNPFLVKVGEYVVKIGYSDCEETVNDRMKQYISKMAEIKY